MSKKMKLTFLFSALILIAIILISFFIICVIPMETTLVIHTINGTDGTEIISMATNLNGYCSNTYLLNENTLVYVLEVKAPLKEILKADKLLENPNITKVVYGWELKTVSPLYTNM